MAQEDLAATRRLPGDPPHRYVDVWGDTVDARHLKWAILIGIGVSFAAFTLANAILSRFVHDLAMARAYAMLVGLGGCLLGGVICARLFKPKRIAAALEADEGRRAHLIATLVQAQGTRRTRRGNTENAAAGDARGARDASAPYGGVASLPPHVIAEMREVGLYDLFAEQERLADLGQGPHAASSVAEHGNDAPTATPGLPESGVTSYGRKEAFR
jgi:hypothetical protein